LSSPLIAELPELRVYKHHRHSVNAIAFSHDGNFFSTASNDANLVLAQADSGIPLLTLKGHKDHALSLVFSKDDKHLYSGGKNGDIIVFETFSGKILGQINVHTDAIREMVTDPSDDYISTISDDNSSIILSKYDIVLGQVFFAANPKAIIWEKNLLQYYISTEIGELFRICIKDDSLTARLKALDDPVLLLDDFTSEYSLFKAKMEKQELNQEQETFWLIKRGDWLNFFYSQYPLQPRLQDIESEIAILLSRHSEDLILKIKQFIANT
jgi:WD40 repeat protein